MHNKSNLELLLLAAGSFVGGIGLGLLLAPKSGNENRQWISDRASELAHMINEKGLKTLAKNEERVRSIRSKVHQSYKDTIPDLYEATKDIDLNDSRLPRY